MDSIKLVLCCVVVELGYGEILTFEQVMIRRSVRGSDGTVLAGYVYWDTGTLQIRGT